jgi:hypothetical protein
MTFFGVVKIMVADLPPFCAQVCVNLKLDTESGNKTALIIDVLHKNVCLTKNVGGG